MRARLAASQAPNRIFDAVLDVAKAAGLVGRRRVLDSTALYDAVATMDTVTLVRSAVRGLLKVAGGELESQLRAVLARDEDYAGAGKPVCDYDDAAARAGLVDALATDGMALLAVLDGRELSEALAQAATLLGTVLGQDLDEDTNGVFRIARRVAPDRVISTVDPQARHGHKTAARGFDGYKGHVGLDPDSEIITATTVTAGNAGDASAAKDLITDLLDDSTDDSTENIVVEGDSTEDVGDPGEGSTADRASVYGDNAYGTGELHARLEQAGIESKCKTQQPVAKGGLLRQGPFPGRPAARHGALSRRAHRTDPAQQQRGRRRQLLAVLHPLPAAPAVHHRPRRTHHHRRRSYERQLADARARQRDPDWITDYRATRPKVERKIAHLMRRRHGGRRARVRGTTKIAADFALLAAAVNLARLAALAVASVPGPGWATATR